jgi:hypothetical protein
MIVNKKLFSIIRAINTIAVLYYAERTRKENDRKGYKYSYKLEVSVFRRERKKLIRELLKLL